MHINTHLHAAFLAGITLSAVDNKGVVTDINGWSADQFRPRITVDGQPKTIIIGEALEDFVEGGSEIYRLTESSEKALADFALKLWVETGLGLLRNVLPTLDKVLNYQVMRLVDARFIEPINPVLFIKISARDGEGGIKVYHGLKPYCGRLNLGTVEAWRYTPVVADEITPEPGIDLSPKPRVF